MTNVKKNSLQSGFSFLEIMIVLTIMALLAGVVGKSFLPALGKGKTTTTKATLQVVDEAIQQYQFDVGQYPKSLDELNHPADGTQGYNGPYLGKKFEKNGAKDAWNQELVYEKGDRGANPPYQLYSEGDPTKEDDRIDA